MISFTIKLADIPIEISTIFDDTKDFFKDYLTLEKPTVFIKVNHSDIEEEREKNKKQSEKAGIFDKKFADTDMEALSIFRKITEALIKYNVILMHGCVVALDGKAYIFTAKSGTGKTTHANLWLKNIKGSYILNGDKPLLMFKNEKVYACGTPWCGKEKYGKNEILPLDGICIIEQAKNNKIEKISASNGIITLLEQTYTPGGNPNSFAVLSLIKKLCEIPIFRLQCNMESDAAIIAHKNMVLENR